MLLADHVDVGKSFSYPVEHCDVALHVPHSLWIICTLQGFPLALLTKVLPFPDEQQIECTVRGVRDFTQPQLIIKNRWLANHSK